MNKRDFFKKLLLGGASFTILPGAGRVWRARRSEWFNLPAITTFDPNFSEFWMTEHPWFKYSTDEYRRRVAKLASENPFYMDISANHAGSISTQKKMVNDFFFNT